MHYISLACDLYASGFTSILDFTRNVSFSNPGAYIPLCEFNTCLRLEGLNNSDRRNTYFRHIMIFLGIQQLRDLPPFLISQGASVLPSFSNPGAYIPFTRSYPFVNFKLSTIIILIPEIHEEQHGSTSLQHDLDTYSGG
jgi:hypothetical protein